MVQTRPKGGDLRYSCVGLFSLVVWELSLNGWWCLVVTSSFTWRDVTWHGMRTMLPLQVGTSPIQLNFPSWCWPHWPSLSLSLPINKIKKKNAHHRNLWDASYVGLMRSTFHIRHVNFEWQWYGEAYCQERTPKKHMLSWDWTKCSRYRRWASFQVQQSTQSGKVVRAFKTKENLLITFTSRLWFWNSKWQSSQLAITKPDDTGPSPIKRPNLFVQLKLPTIAFNLQLGQD